MKLREPRMKNNENNATKAGIWYTIGNLFVKGINFLTLPIFSRIMTTAQFGAYNVFISYEAILCLVCGVAMHSSLKNAKIEFPNQIDSYTSSITIIYIINTIVLLTISTIFSGFLLDFIGFSGWLIYILILFSFSNSIVLLFNNRVSLDYSYKKYLITALCNSLCNVGLSLILMFTLFKEFKDVGRILGASISLFVISVVLLRDFYKKSKPEINLEYWKFAFKYSLPMVAHGLSQVLLAQFDRIMIQRICGSSDAGIYSLAGNLKLILTILTDSIITSWGVWFFEEIEKNEIEKIKKRAVQLAQMFFVVAIVTMFISPELINVLGGDSYYLANYVATPMIVDAFLLMLYSIIVQGEYYKKKTNYVMVGTVIATLIDIVLNIIFIPKYGFVAAAYTTLFSYVCYLTLHYFICFRIMQFTIIPLGQTIILSFLIFVCAAINIIFIDWLLIRLIICIAIVIPIGIYFLKTKCKR